MNPDTARGVALGTGMRASAISTSALAYNPAALVLGKLYHLEGSVDYMPGFNTVALGGAVVDSATSKIGAGISFRGFLSGDLGVSGMDIHGALALPFSELVSVGLGARYVDLEYEVPLADDDTIVVGKELAQGFTMDASLRIAPMQGLSLQALAINFINMDSVFAPVILGGGAAYTILDMVTLGMDVLFDVSTYESAALTIGGGAEILISQVVPIRIGYSYDVERDMNILSGGIGYTDRQVGVDFSVQQQLDGPTDTRFIGAVRYYVQ
jgi:hypothetical protein